MRAYLPMQKFLWLTAACIGMSLALPAMASAQTEVSTYDVPTCSDVDGTYIVYMSAYDGIFEFVPAFPATVTLYFEGGMEATAEATSGSSHQQRYELADINGTLRPHALLGAGGYVSDLSHRAYFIEIASYPCPSVISDVSGVIVQHGNNRPVEGLTVCLVQLSRCVLTDASGSFVLTGIPEGTYTLTSDGPHYRLLTTEIEVGNVDVHLNLVQRRGGR